jgi:hypothetical protein
LRIFYKRVLKIILFADQYETQVHGGARVHGEIR